MVIATGNEAGPLTFIRPPPKSSPDAANASSWALQSTTFGPFCDSAPNLTVNMSSAVLVTMYVNAMIHSFYCLLDWLPAKVFSHLYLSRWAIKTILIAFIVHLPRTLVIFKELTLLI